MNLGGYPMGAEYDPRAPYNQKENDEVEVEVCVSITLHKTFKLIVRDYEVTHDGELDFTDCDLYGAAEKQLDLSAPSKSNGWTEDEFEIILE